METVVVHYVLQGEELAQIRKSRTARLTPGMLVFGAVDPRLTRARLAILEVPADDHRLEDLAEESGMSRSLFAERFAEAFQRPPMDLVRQVRLHRAANLLRATSLPVQVFAQSASYASRSYLSRAIRATYGPGPKAFQEQRGEAEVLKVTGT